MIRLHSGTARWQVVWSLFTNTDILHHSQQDLKNPVYQRITESAGHGQSIFEYAPKTKGASAFKALAGPGWHRCLANQVASPLVCDWAIALGDEVERPQFMHSQMTLKQRGEQRLLQLILIIILITDADLSTCIAVARGDRI